MNSSYHSTILTSFSMQKCSCVSLLNEKKKKAYVKYQMKGAKEKLFLIDNTVSCSMCCFRSILKYLKQISMKKTLMPPASVILHVKGGLITAHKLLFQQITKDQWWNPVLCSKEATTLNCGPEARRSDMGAAFLWSLRHSEWAWWIIVWNFTISGIE